MTYQQFKLRNDENKKYVSTIGRITDINWEKDTCVLHINNKSTQVKIPALVQKIAVDGLRAITNGYLLRRWWGFDK